MYSVIVPAHNEEAVIGRCLSALVSGVRSDEMEVIVVCNGCTDATAREARAIVGPITIIETEVASKSHALNIGDEAARGFPRWYLDADIQVTLDAVRNVNSVMEASEIPAAAPRMTVDLSDRGKLIRAYYDIWTRLPYVTEGMIGSGVYVLSRSGRSRFRRFPDVIGDDAFIRLLFDPEERMSVEQSTFTVTPPRSLRVLTRVRARRRIAAEEMAEFMPETAENDKALQRSGIRRLAKQPFLWPPMIVYLGTRLSAEILYQLRYRLRGHKEWERDDTSR